jgi:hypothetical protein
METPADPPASNELVWISKYPMNNLLFWRYFLGFTLPVAVVILLLALAIRAPALAVVIDGMLGLLLLITFLACAATDVQNKGGADCLFGLTAMGVHFHSGLALRSDVSPILKQAAQRQSPEMLSRLAEVESPHDRFIPWSAIRSLEFRPASRSVIVSKGFSGPVLLCCTPDNYDAVRAFLLARKPAGARVKESGLPLNA